MRPVTQSDAVLSQLLPTLHKFNCSRSNSRLPGLNNASLENDLIALLPHLRPERLPWKNNACEADLDVFEGSKRLVDVLSSDAHEAESMKDGDLEAADFGEFGVNMEGVSVSTESVKDGLVFGGLLFDYCVGLPRWGLVGGGGSSAVCGLGWATEVSGATDEDGELVNKHEVAGGVPSLGPSNDNSCCSLVNNLKEDGMGSQCPRSWDWVFLNFEELLAMEEHHGVELRNNLVIRERGLGSKGWDDT